LAIDANVHEKATLSDTRCRRIAGKLNLTSIPWVDGYVDLHVKVSHDAYLKVSVK